MILKYNTTMIAREGQQRPICRDDVLVLTRDMIPSGLLCHRQAETTRRIQIPTGGTAVSRFRLLHVNTVKAVIPIIDIAFQQVASQSSKRRINSSFQQQMPKTLQDHQ
eukprot:m.9310 g.9310  ORF g.9310 m.9310 type:complete len:108 (+) comp5440_c0_seq1:113-436(+)